MKFSSDVKYKFGDLVILKTDTDRLPRMVISLLFSPNKVLYGLTLLEEVSYHIDLEIEKELIRQYNNSTSDMIWSVLK